MKKTGPGETHNRHKIKFSEQAREVIRISDIILEVIDARHIGESRIPELEELIVESGKMFVPVLTKADLIDTSKLSKNEEFKQLESPILISVPKKQGLAKLRERIHVLARHTTHAQTHVGVIGYPNTGKSSLISALARRAAAPKSSQPGFTKGIRKIRFAKGILLLDSPGVIRSEESLFNAKDLKKQALLGTKTPETVKAPDLIVLEVMKLNPGLLEKYYEIDAEGDVEVLLEELGKRLNILKRQGVIDTDKVARRILKDFQAGKIR